MLWEIDIRPAPGRPDRAGATLSREANDLGLAEATIATTHGYLLEGDLDSEKARELARQLLGDPVVETVVVAPVGDAAHATPPAAAAVNPASIYVLPKPGVTDPVAESVLKATVDFGAPVSDVRTYRRYWVSGLGEAEQKTLANRLLSNASIEDTVFGALQMDHLHLGSAADFHLEIVPLRTLDDAGLQKLSIEGQLHLTLPEMQTIQQHFESLGRDPTDAELETVAQTWSEHCSHKTLAGRIAYRDENGERQFENMLKETIFAATVEIRQRLGDADWCISVFRDNAGIVHFDEEHHVAFKVETHNHPSAIEPYGGSNTGIGGVIRDTLGTGLGAKPICNTDVFCFAPPDTPMEQLPPNTLHPRRIMNGVVAGVRDYGNRMGIPTVNGAICFDPRYIGNPLVYCGNVGILPHDKCFKEPQPNDLVVAIGGRTGRDGIHGATFSSAPMTSESESISGGAVQIGNAITEKMVMDVMLAARDEGLFTAVTDCGAGGFSSAVGEMGESIGAEVYLDKAPLKYEGLTYTEIWISEAQERMVFSVPPECWERFHSLCESEGVEATVIGKFVPTGRLRLLYEGNEVADVSMEFLHDGRPPVIRQAVYEPVGDEAMETFAADLAADAIRQTVLDVLGSLNVCSKEWVIRQYDHEVQGGSVVKPLVGVCNDGPSDAAVVRPVLGSPRGLVVSCGINPRYGDLDPYHMAASAIDEAIRNAVAVGADPDKIAILDNFCWGHTDRPETLGSLVRAAIACQDVSIAMGTPFISGKDSLNNEFHFEDADGEHAISIPSTLLISALGQIDAVSQAVTMDLKKSGNAIYLLGVTKNEMGGSHFGLVRDRSGGAAPTVDPAAAMAIYRQLCQAIRDGLVRSCHDLSEGGLAVAAAEMCIAGRCGATIDVNAVVTSGVTGEVEQTISRLFSESNSRLLCEVTPENEAAFAECMSGLVAVKVGRVDDSESLVLQTANQQVEIAVADMVTAWQKPLAWHPSEANA